MHVPGYVKAGEIRIDHLQVNIIGIAVSIPVTIAFGLTEFLVHGIPTLNPWPALLFPAAFCVQLALHELLHAVGYLAFGGRSWNQLKFGVNWKALMVYCNCLAPVPMPAFRLTCLLPTLVLFPLSIAAWLIFKQWWLSFFSAVVLMGGIGDVIMMVKTLAFPSNLFIVEHPSGIGGDLFVARTQSQNPETISHGS